MAITIVGSTSFAGASATQSHSVNAPTGIQDGDLGILVLTQNGTSTFYPPSGWTQVGPMESPNNALRVYVFSKTMAATDSGAAINYSFSTSQRSVKAVTVVRGTQGVGVVASGVSGGTADTPMTYPGLTPLANDALLVAVAGIRYSTTTTGVTQPAGWTEQVDAVDPASSAPRFGVTIATKQLSGQSGAAQSDATATLADIGLWGDVTFSLQPVVVATDASYSAPAMTGSAAFPGGDVPRASVTKAATPMTALATAVDAVGMGNVVALTVTEDTYAIDSTNHGSETTYIPQYTYFKFDASAIPAGTVETSRTLILHEASGLTGSAVLGIYSVLSDWSESVVTISNQPSTSLYATRTMTYSGTTGLATIDISGADVGYGVLLRTLGGNTPPTVYSSEYSVVGSRPYAKSTIAAPTSVSVIADPVSASAGISNPVVVPGFENNFAAGPATASMTLVAPNVHTQSGGHYSAQAMAASAATVDPAVTAERFVSITVSAEPMSASGSMPASGFAVNRTVSANTLTAIATTVDASVSTTRGALITNSPMPATAVLVEPNINGSPITVNESDDAYFNRVISLNPKTWLRLNDKGITAKDRITGNAYGIYNNVQVNKADGPQGRASVHFTGTSYIDSNEGGPSSDEATADGPHALEFSFRTTQPNQFLMISQDSVIEALATNTSPPIEVGLSGGKIRMRYWNFGFPDLVQFEFTGFRNLNDGQWHSVVIRSADASSGAGNNTTGSGVEVWIDGTFEIRRYGWTGFEGFPDYIGGRPTSIESGSTLPTLASAEWFVGDMSEVVFYSLSNLDKEIIPRNYYAFMGWNPIEAGTVEAFAFTPAGAQGHGNQKRMLALYWSDAFDSLNRGGSGNGKVNFDPLLAFTSGVTDYEGYKVFGRSVTMNNTTGKPYRDPVTDEFSLLNLETDINVDDYDVITFQDWPDEGPEIDAIEAEFPGQKDRLVRQLLAARSRGVGLFVVQPRLAVDLGIIDRVEFVPTLRESKFSPGQGNAAGLYDYGSAVKFPWNISGSSGLVGASGAGSPFNGQPQNLSPSYLAAKAYYYGDTNKNDRFRVRALIDGLTTIPSYMIQDAIFQADYDPWGWQGVAYKYLHRDNGLEIGDEYLFHGSDFGRYGDWSDVFEYMASRQEGTYATPPGHVLAGTVVTTFGLTLWQDKQEVANPYSEYATTIVLEPDDVLNGTTGGKVFVNFSEEPNLQPDNVIIQVLPDDDNGLTWPTNYVPDTDAQREWEWSFTRQSLNSTGGSQGTQTVTFVDALGNNITIQANTNGGLSLSQVRSTNLFPITAKASYQMVSRGLFWLMDRPEAESAGSVTHRASTAIAVAEMPSPAVVAQHNVDVSAEAMAAIEVMPKVAQDDSGDVDILTLPLKASAQFTGYGKTISAAPMTAAAELVDNFDAVHATGEQVVLTVYGFDVVLYMKEEA